MKKYELIEISGTESQLAAIHKALPSLLIEGWYAFVDYLDPADLGENSNIGRDAIAEVEDGAVVYGKIIGHVVSARRDLFGADEANVEDERELQRQKILNFLNPPEGEKVTKAQSELVNNCQGVELAVDGDKTVIESVSANQEPSPIFSGNKRYPGAHLVETDLLNAKVVLQTADGSKIEAMIPEAMRSLFRDAMARSYGDYVVSEEPSAGGSGRRVCLVEAPFFSDKKLFVED